VSGTFLRRMLVGRLSMRLAPAFAVTLGAWLSLAGVPALADTHPFLFSFGSFSNPNGIAVDQSSGDVYVADIATSAVQKFDASGKPVEFSALHSNVLTGSATPAKAFAFPSEYGNPAAVAVDNSNDSSDPSAKDLYVMDEGNAVVDKFSPDGAYLGQIALAGTEPLGIGVDASGSLRIDERPFKSDFVAIGVYDDSATNNFVTFLEPHYGSYGMGMEPERAFAVGPAGDGYALFSCHCIEKFGPNIEELGRVDNGFADIAVAVDQTDGHVYVDEQSSVAEWDPGEMNGKTHNKAGEETSSGVLVSSFGSLQLSSSSGQGGIAVNATTGDIYVSSPADGKVYVFSSATPAVVAGAATNVTKTSATLTGAIDPRGAPIVSCQFEYGTSESYGQSAECAQTPAEIGSGSGLVAVSADIAGLQPGVLYHFRLAANSAAGTGTSTGLFATAGPGFGIKRPEVKFLNRDGTPDTQAGSHPYEMITNIAFNTTVLRRETVDSRYMTQPDGNFKDLITNLPPGLVGDPNGTAKKCTLKQLDKQQQGGEQCPPDSFVGTLEVEFGDNYPTLESPVYNMVPPHGVAAQFAAHFIIPNAFIDFTVGPEGNYGVTATVSNSPAIVPVIRTKLTVFGVSVSGEQKKALLTMPTSCSGPLTTMVSADSYQNPGHYVSASAVSRNASGEPGGMTGCSQLVFPPAIAASPDVPDASTSSGLTVGVHVSQKAALNPEGLAESALRNTTVTLPEGVAINPAGADGLEACSEALAGFTGFAEFNPEFEPGSKTATFTGGMPEPLQPGSNFCPNGSKIGTVKLKTPLLTSSVEGAVYLATQNANPFGSLVAMYLIAEDPVSGTILKLAGEVRLCEREEQLIEGVSCKAVGQIITTFRNSPELPFEELELHFFGGERAPLTTPPICRDETPEHPGAYTTTAVFTPWDGNGPVTATSSFKIEHGPNGAPCPGASLPFNPSLAAGTTNIQAAAFSPFTMTMSREDGNQDLQAIGLHLPPGFSGVLSGVKLCGEAEADAGTCGPESEIGETVVSVGVGGDPFSVKGGKVFITGPYKGAPFGLSIVNPAKAGPFDLGQVVVRAKLEVDPITAALTVTTDDTGPYRIPEFLDGIPLQIKHVNVTIDRPRFTLNPTGCDPMTITADLSSTEGAVRQLSAPFQVTNCRALAFKPLFRASTQGKTSRKRGASLYVKLTYPPNSLGRETNIAKVKVSLPRRLPSRLKTLQKACPDSTFAANPSSCPAASRVGTARATTPILPVPLTGPAYFVSHGGAKFPELIIVLQGYGVTVDLHSETFINKAGITSSTFRTIPDVPVGTFELRLPQGPDSALAANGRLCSRKLVMPTAFTAQDGAVIHQNIPIAVTGCAKRKRTKRHGVRSSRS
jgi:DNA-binding beta-propeller fold protein YncE